MVLYQHIVPKLLNSSQRYAIVRPDTVLPGRNQDSSLRKGTLVACFAPYMPGQDGKADGVSEELSWLQVPLAVGDKQRMKLTDNELAVFDQKVLKLPAASRETYTRQVDYLIERLAAKIREDGSFGVRKFLKAGSLQKRTVLKPRDGFGVDADIAVYLKAGDDFDLDTLHDTIRALLIAIYPPEIARRFPGAAAHIGYRVPPVGTGRRSCAGDAPGQPAR